jgi:hypothetical protein
LDVGREDRERGSWDFVYDGEQEQGRQQAGATDAECFPKSERRFGRDTP